ncbi:MAG: hypothetical protein J2P17_00780 [Mycobacterium sp.]|nr:hypothetical protein [Mycobacterium sp.]
MTSPTSISWTGSVVFTGATDPLETGVATLTLTPSVGLSNLPALVQGESGLPPVLNFSTTTLAAGASATVTATLVSPGGAGTAAVYNVVLGIPQGAAGAAGTNATLTGASDLEGGPPGAGTDGYVIAWNQADGKWKISQPRKSYGPYSVQNSSFAAAYNGNLGSYQVAAVGVPAMPYAWRPVVHAGMYATGTANTHVDLVCRLNNPTSGDIVGYGLGQTGVGPYPIVCQPAFGSTIAGSSTYGQVAAGATATIYLIATQINSTTDAWQTVNTNGYFTVEVLSA